MVFQYSVMRITVFKMWFLEIENRANKKKGVANLVVVTPFLLSGLLDSNQRPRAPQTCALPTALNPEHCL